MPKIRLLEKGFEKLTGFFGVVEFKDGVSVHDVSEIEIDRIAAVARIGDLDGNPLGVAERMAAGIGRPAPVESRLKTAEEMKLPPEKPVKQEPPAAADPMPRFYTEAELGEIADNGIKALREIGDAWGVKGRSINELIKDILAAQEKFKKSRGIVVETKRAEDELLGSTILPQSISISPHLDKVPQSKVVERAFKESGLSVAAWNELPEKTREIRLQEVVDAMRAEALAAVESQAGQVGELSDEAVGAVVEAAVDEVEDAIAEELGLDVEEA